MKKNSNIHIYQVQYVGTNNLVGAGYHLVRSVREYIIRCAPLLKTQIWLALFNFGTHLVSTFICSVYCEYFDTVSPIDMATKAYKVYRGQRYTTSVSICSRNPKLLGTPDTTGSLGLLCQLFQWR